MTELREFCHRTELEDVRSPSHLLAVRSKRERARNENVGLDGVESKDDSDASNNSSSVFSKQKRILAEG